MIDGIKQCNICEKVLNIGDFWPNMSRCKECNYEKGKDRQFKYHLKKKYGITLEKYDEVLEKQEGKCAICEEGSEKQGCRRLGVHSHEGNIGLLCARCTLITNACNSSLKLLENVTMFLIKQGYK